MTDRQLTDTEKAHVKRLASGGSTAAEIAARLDRPIAEVKKAVPAKNKARTT